MGDKDSASREKKQKNACIILDCGKLPNEEQPTCRTKNQKELYICNKVLIFACKKRKHLWKNTDQELQINFFGNNWKTLIDDGARTLYTLASKIDTAKMQSPSFLMVLTGVGDYAYQRKDGVMVVPISCLKD